MMMKDSKTQYCCSKFPWADERTSSKIIDNLGTRSHNGSPALTQTMSFVAAILILGSRVRILLVFLLCYESCKSFSLCLVSIRNYKYIVEHLFLQALVYHFIYLRLGTQNVSFTLICAVFLIKQLICVLSCLNYRRNIRPGTWLVSQERQFPHYFINAYVIIVFVCLSHLINFKPLNKSVLSMIRILRHQREHHRCKL